MADEKSKKKKLPTALKRIKQSENRNALSSAFKSRIRTAIRAFEKAFSSGEKEQVRNTLNTVYSLMDKGVKKGIINQSKAARVKAQLATAEKRTA